MKTNIGKKLKLKNKNVPKLKTQIESKIEIKKCNKKSHYPWFQHNKEKKESWIRSLDDKKKYFKKMWMVWPSSCVDAFPAETGSVGGTYQ